jgi:hypothetical protein
MKKINFEEMEFYLNIEKTQKRTQNVKSQFANAIYVGATGIEMHALAMKIYESKGETEFTDKECSMIQQVTNQFTPMFIDAINNVLDKQDNNKNEK